MRGRLLVAAVLSLLAAGGAQAQDARGQIEAAYAAWNAAFNKADAKGVAAFYTDDAKLLPPTHDVLTGPDAVATFFGGLFSSGVSNHRLELVDATDLGDTTVGAAKWAADGKDASGAAAAFGGVAVHVFEKQPDGSLKLRMHTFN